MERPVVTTDQIIDEMRTYVRNCAGLYPGWYCGITHNPRHRLFTFHKVKPPEQWIHGECGSMEQAKEIEAYFLKQGCKGGSAVFDGKEEDYEAAELPPGGENESAGPHVYLYKIERHTHQVY